MYPSHRSSTGREPNWRMKKILCPTDFSDSAQNATAYAAKLAHALGAELLLYHVRSIVGDIPATFLGEPAPSSSYEKLLDEQSREISRMFKISCYAEVESSTSSLVNTISRKADEFDVLVLGTHRPTDLLQFLMGSTAYKAALKSRIPLCLIPANFLYREITTIVYAYDYLRTNKLPTEQLFPFVKSLKDPQLIILEIASEAPSERMEIELQELQLLLKRIHGHEIGLHFHTLRSAATAPGIKTYISEQQPDLLAVCTRDHGFLGGLFHKSILKELSFVAPCPVFVFHH